MPPHCMETSHKENYKLRFFLIQKNIESVNCNICSSNDLLKKYINFFTMGELHNLLKIGSFSHKNSSYRTILCEILVNRL